MRMIDGSMQKKDPSSSGANVALSARGFSRIERIGIVGGLVVVLGYILFTYTSLGGTLMNMPLRVEPKTESGLVGYWSFDTVYAASSSGEVIDDSGQGNHGNIMNNASTSDAIVDATSGATDTWHLNASPQTVFVSESKGYVFSVDTGSNCVVASTTDGGATWSAPQNVDTVNTADCIGISVWYDGWTPGLTPTSSTSTKIHIATIDTSVDDIYYTSLDTESDQISGTQLTMTQAATLTTAANYVSIARAGDSRLYVTVHDTSDSFMLTCSANCHTTANWSEIAATTNTLADDTPLLVALPATTTVMKILLDVSADDYLANIYNPTTGTWRATTTIDAAAPDNTTYDAHFGATVDAINNKVYFVYAADVNDYVTQDHDVRSAVYDPVAQTWTSKTNVITNSSGGITDAKVAYDANSNTVFAIYTVRSTIGTAATARTYFKTSTDGMTTWGPEQGPVDVGASDWYGGSDVNILGDRIFNSRHSASGGGGTDVRWGNTVSLNTGVYAFTEGKVGQGYKFDGVDDYVEIADTDAFSPTAGGFSVSAWVNLDTITPPDGSSQEPVSKGSNSNFEWALRAESNGTAAFVLFQADGTNHCIAAGASTVLAPATWYHLTGVWTGSDCELYVNAARLDFNNSLTGSLTNGTAPLRIGKRASNNRQTKGKVDEVRLYNRALTADEVDQIYKIGATTKINTTLPTKPALENGLVGHWTLDGADVTPTTARVTEEIRDRSGNDNHGDWQDHATTTTVGRIGQGIVFDGLNDDIEIPDAPELDVGGGDWTTSFWAKTSSTTGELFVINKRLGGNDKEFEVYLRAATREVVAECENAASGGSSTSADGVWNIGEWFQVAVTFDGLTRIPTYYVNGQLVGTDSNTITDCDPPSTAPVKIASRSSAAGPYFEGALDDVRLYNRQLSAAEVADLYQLGATSKVNTTVTSQPSLENDLQAHWTFDGDRVKLSNNTMEILDRSVNAYHGDWQDHASTTVPGKIGQGIQFDGVDDDINFGGSTNLLANVSAVTFAAWVRPDPGANNPFVGTTIGGGGLVNRGACTADASDGTISASGRAPDGGGGVSGSVSGGVVPNVWQHVVCIIDYANDLGTFYLNGQLKGTAAMAFTDTTTTNNSPTAVRAGSSPNGLNEFLGALDDVRIYHRALSADEVMMLYQLGN